MKQLKKGIEEQGKHVRKPPNLLKMKMLGKHTYAYVSFPNRPIKMREMALQGAALKPHLTFTMPAVIALLATFLVDHRVTAALRTKIASDA